MGRFLSPALPLLVSLATVLAGVSGAWFVLGGILMLTIDDLELTEMGGLAVVDCRVSA